MRGRRDDGNGWMGGIVGWLRCDRAGGILLERGDLG